MDWEIDAKSSKHVKEIADAMKDADRLILATDPDREGEAISWHVLEALNKRRRSRARPSSASPSTPSPRRPSRPRWPPRATSTWSWSTPTSPAARSIISSASRSRRCCGASCRARARRAACNRWRCASSSTAKSRSRSSSRRNIGASTPSCRRTRGDIFPARLSAFEGKKLKRLDIAERGDGARRARRGEERRLQSRRRRSQTDKPQSAAALHDLDAAAGSRAQARLLRLAHDADGAAPLRRRRIGGETRPHHLYADRRRLDGRRRDARAAHRHRQAIRQRIRAGRAAQVRVEDQERAGSARSDPPDRSDRTPRQLQPRWRPGAGSTI